MEASNLQRQVVHGVSDVGRLKVDSARATLAEINPLVEVLTHPVRLDSSNALDVLAGYDLVVDGTDNFATRYLVNDACVLLGVPCVWGSIYRFDGQTSVFWAGRGPCYRCLFPVPPPAGSVPSCAEGGVLGLLCAAIGAAQGTEVVKLVAGIGTPLVGRLLVHDALRATWRELTVRPDPACVVCGDVAEHHPRDRADRLRGVLRAARRPDDVVARPTRSWARSRAKELADLLDARERGQADVVLVDVREPGERAIVSIPGAVAVPRAAFDDGEAFAELPFDRPVVLHCRSGVRSATALELLLAAGHPDARHLEGGVLAWVEQVDPSLPTY